MPMPMLCLRSVSYSLFVLALGCYPDSDKIRNLAGSGTGGSDGNPTKPDAAAADVSMTDTRGATGDTLGLGDTVGVADGGTGAGGGEACNDPKFPKLCAARNGEEAICVTPGADCSTLMRCPDRIRVCGSGAVVDCRYPNCTPVGCPDASFPRMCPARAGVGPACWRGDIDCGTVTLCNGELRGCAIGNTFDCAKGMCVPASQCAATPTKPLYCAASGDYPGGCWESSTECGSIVDCAGTPRACTGPNLVRDCTETNCLPASQCLYQTAGSACGQCVRHKCCKILNDCVADPSCIECSGMNAPASCDDTTTAPPGWINYLQCALNYCAGTCTQ